jgi:2-polyprenyl-6-hydroxyphenyl methylase/3-demethylubiquinone-9 3-methyltransferase
MSSSITSARPAGEYGYSDSQPGWASHYLHPVIRPLVCDLPAGSVVADLGCGNGSFLARYRDRRWVLYGLETSVSGLNAARSAYPEIIFEQADLVQDLSSHPLAGRCDLVLSTEVIEHVFLPRQFVRNCQMFLRHGGRLILSTPYHGYAKNLALALTGKMDDHFTALWDFGHIKFWSRQTLTQLLEEAGLEVVSFHGTGRIPYLWKSMVIVARKR